VRALADNVHEFTVSELSFALKRQIEESFGHVRVRGEIGRVSRPGSGHLYLDLKDERSVISAVIWKGSASGMRIKPEQGLEVIATGRLTTFPGQSKYQLVIEHMEPAGIGALMALLEERRKTLAAEGLFEPSRKKPLPFLPRVIGVVTSPSGAVIRDILHRLADRFPRRVLVWPALVQGERAAGEVAAAIRGFNALPETGPVPRPDLLIVARGGGSLEDLWAFNEEIVVRAAAESRIPLISAVGHETDTTLIDFAADRRAPTPTAAAEMAVPVRAELLAQLQDRGARLIHAEARLLDQGRGTLMGLARALPRPLDLLALARQRFDGCAERLPRVLADSVGRRRLALGGAAARLSAHPLLRDVQRHHLRLRELEHRAEASARRQVEHGLQRLGAIRLKAGLKTNLDRHEAALAAAVQHGERLLRSARHAVETRLAVLAGLDKLLEALSYETVLERGYALVHRADGDGLVMRHAQAEPGLPVQIEFRDGRVGAVLGTTRTPKPKRKPGTPQGELF
jgi:exodeoxyribonuclease VII large subunit